MGEYLEKANSARKNPAVLCTFQLSIRRNIQKTWVYAGRGATQERVKEMQGGMPRCGHTGVLRERSEEKDLKKVGK